MSLKRTGYLASALLLSTLGSCSVDNTASTEATATTLTVGGSSEAYEMIEVLAEAYGQTGAAEFEFAPSSQTSGGIEGVKADELDIGGVSRKLTEADLNGELSYLPMVETPMVVVVHDSVTGVTDITAEQIKAVYSGEITNWQELGGPDETIVLFDLSEDENEKVVLREVYLGTDLAISPDAIVFTEDDELVEALAVTDFSMATVPAEDELEELPLSPLTIDGIQPTAETMQSGSYPLSLALGIVIPAAPNETLQAFIDFATSTEAQELLTDAEYVVADGTVAK